MKSVCMAVLLAIFVLASADQAKSSSNGANPGNAGAPPVTAPDPLTALEERLLYQSNTALTWDGTATGSVVARLHASIAIASTDSATITVRGVSGTKPAEARLTVQADVVLFGTGKSYHVRGRAFLKNMWLNFVRIGFMHDAHGLADGSAHDLAEAAASHDAETIHLHDISVQAPAAGERRKVQPVRFLIDYGRKKDVAAATLFISVKTGLPVKREQVVHFPRGDMRVIEYYHWSAAPREVPR